MSSNFIFCFITLLFCTCGSFGFERKLTSYNNPGCTSCDLTLTHVTADGPNDTLHYIWSFVGRPTLILAVTEPHTGLDIEWNDLLFKNPENSLKFNNTPLYSFGLSINRVFEFRDINDTANIENVADEDIISMSAEYFEWNAGEPIQNEDGSISLEVTATEFNDSSNYRSGNISIKITGFGKDGHGSQLPHLLHSANCSQLEVTLQGLETSPQFEGHSRFALELLLASSEQEGNGAQVTTHRSLDDEHTPGVFTVVDLLTPTVMSGDLGGFLQWRPVAYTLPSRDIESSTEAHHYKIHNSSEPVAQFKNTLLFAFYGYELDQLMAQSLNVSFGVSEDGFYNATNFITWSVSVGYGQPPAEHLSLLVILVLGVGLGIPIILMIFGGLYMLLFKHTRAKDELLLSR